MSVSQFINFWFFVYFFSVYYVYQKIKDTSFFVSWIFSAILDYEISIKKLIITDNYFFIRPFQ